MRLRRRSETWFLEAKLRRQGRATGGTERLECRLAFAPDPAQILDSSSYDSSYDRCSPPRFAKAYTCCPPYVAMYRDLLPQRPLGYHVRSLGLLMFLPFLMFTSLTALSSFTFRMPGLTWALAMFYLGIALLFMVVRQSRDGPRFWFHAGDRS